MFHKVVWQHVQGVVEFLINHFTANLPRNLPEKTFWILVKIWQNYGHEFVAPLFGLPCSYWCILRWALCVFQQGMVTGAAWMDVQDRRRFSGPHWCLLESRLPTHSYNCWFPCMSQLLSGSHGFDGSGELKLNNVEREAVTPVWCCYVIHHYLFICIANLSKLNTI